MSETRARRSHRRNDPVGEARRWNMHVLVGDPVVVTRDDGSKLETVTTSEAWVLGASSRDPGHTAVVLVVGIRGGYLLSRVQPTKALRPSPAP